VIRLKLGGPWVGGRGLRSARAWYWRPARAWYWRPASLLMLGVIAGVLLALPPAGATDAHRSSGKSPARSALDVAVVGDFFSYGYA
jgi:hypothetical protein